MEFSGTPTKKLSAPFNIYEDRDAVEVNMVRQSYPSLPEAAQLEAPCTYLMLVQAALKHSSNGLPLTTSKLANQLPVRRSPQVRKRFILREANETDIDISQKSESVQQSPVEQLLAKLTQQQEALSRKKQHQSENSGGDGSSSATDPYANTPPTESVANSDGRPDAVEVFRLKKELELAQERMAQMDLELTQSRITKHTVEEAIGSPFPAAQHLAYNITGSGMHSFQNGYQGRASPIYPLGHHTQGQTGPLRIDTTVQHAGDMYTPQ